MNKLTLDERIGVPVVVAVAFAVAFRFLVPTSHWFSVDQMDVQDATSWEGVKIDFDRTITRDFFGAWRIDMRKEVPDGWVSVCSTQWQPNNYTTNSALPDPVTLEWFTWVEPRCYQLDEPGRYEITATWVINPGSWLFERQIKRMDRFNILGKEIS